MHRQRLASIPLLAVLLASLLPMQPALAVPIVDSQRLAQRPSNQQTGARSLVKQGLDQFQHGIATADTKVMGEAAQTFQSAIASAQNQGDREAEAIAQLSLGGVSNSRLRPKHGKEACQRSLELYQNLATPSGEALSQFCLGSSYILLGKLDKAREALQNALTLYQQFKEPYGEAATNLALGGSYLMVNKPQQARAAFQRSLELYQGVGDPAGEAHALLNVGGSYLIQQEFEQAIPFYEQARERFRQLNQPSGEIMILFFMSLAYGGAKKPQKVIEVSEALQRMLAQENISLEASFENLVVEGATIAMPRLLMNHYERTSNRTHPVEAKTLQNTEVPAFREVVASQEGVGSAEFTNNLGRAYILTGQYQKAIDSFQKALEIYKTTNDRQGEIQATMNLAQAYSFIGQYQQSIVQVTQAVKLSREIERPYELALSLYILGQIQLVFPRQEDDRTTEEKAIANLQESLAIFQTLDKSSEEAMVLSLLGTTYVLQQRYQDGIDVTQRSLDLARKRGDRIREVPEIKNLREVLEIKNLNLGEAYLPQHQYLQAIALSRQALPIRQTIQNPDIHTAPAFMLGLLGVALFKSGQVAEAEQYLRESIQLWSLRHEPLNDLNKIKFFETQPHYLYTVLQQLLIAKGQPEAALEIAEQGRARAFMELLAGRWNRSGDAPPLIEATDFSKIQRIARDQNATLVEYSIASDFAIGESWPRREVTLFIWVVQPTGTLTFRQVNLKPLDRPLKDLIADTRQYMMIGDSSLRSQHDELTLQVGDRVRVKTEPLSYDVRQVVDFDSETGIAKIRFADDPDALIREVSERELEGAISPITIGLQQLHQLLIDPIADVLPTDPEAQIIFVPHQELFLVPFAALQDSQGQFLIEKHTLVTAPAIQVLAETHKRRENLSGEGQDVLVVGNPSPMPAALPNLPGAAEEARKIASLLKTKPILGVQATEAAIKDQMFGVRTIHLATHSTFDQDPLQRFIALAPAKGEDGLLTAEEIYRFDNQLIAELVVLSACDTGRGPINSDGVMGLARSWFAAGVPSAIVSLWKVSDDATTDLMTEFYRHWQQGQNKAQALRQAMLTTIKTYPHPADWAAFRLIGEAE